jgi:hypothetical protein
VGTNGNTAFVNFLHGSASEEDKMAVWRQVLDLRRAHTHQVVEMVIKALIETKGDASRANMLLGNKDFAILNPNPLPSRTRTAFLPIADKVNRKSSKGKGHRNGFDGIRALRDESKPDYETMGKKNKLVETTNSIVLKTYFSQKAAVSKRS